MVNEINSDEMHNEISSDGLLEKNGNQILLLVLGLWLCRHFVVVTQTMNSVTKTGGGVIFSPLLKPTE